MCASETVKTEERGRSHEVAAPLSRGREHAPSTHRSRSRSKSRLRKPKNAGSKLKGMVKKGWKSFKGSSNKSVTSSSDVASRDTADSVALLNTATSTALLDNVGTSTTTTTATSLELVVLLMDPLSRRFELLQLEFDSARAKVSDLLTQIPLSVTEPALQEQPYVGVLDSNGTLEEGSARLLEKFGSPNARHAKMVLVAKPKGLSTKETMRLAKPILMDTQVSKMLQASGFQVDGWKSKKVTTPTSRSLDDIPYSERVAVGGAVGGSKSTKSSSSLLSYALMVVAFAVALSSIHSVLSKPIELDTTVKYGTTKYKCGVMSVVPGVAKEVVKTLLEPFQPDIQSDSTSIWNCQNEYMAVSKEGIVITDNNGDVVLDIKTSGKVLDCSQVKKNKKCVDGLYLSKNKSLKMGTQKLTAGTSYGYNDNLKLSPWPFTASPKVSIYKRAPLPSSS